MGEHKSEMTFQEQMKLDTNTYPIFLYVDNVLLDMIYGAFAAAPFNPNLGDFANGSEKFLARKAFEYSVFQQGLSRGTTDPKNIRIGIGSTQELYAHYAICRASILTELASFDEADLLKLGNKSVGRVINLSLWFYLLQPFIEKTNMPDLPAYEISGPMVSLDGTVFTPPPIQLARIRFGQDGKASPDDTDGIIASLLQEVLSEMMKSNSINGKPVDTLSREELIMELQRSLIEKKPEAAVQDDFIRTLDEMLHTLFNAGML